MADAPTHLRIRSYNVGFGDCFLLTFSYPDGEPRNVLIDFGSTELSSGSPEGGLLSIAKQIREDSGGKLEMVVATHRHADHISGFGGKPGEIIKALQPELVVQPWTEDPDLDPEARGPAGRASDGRLRARTVAARLSDMQALAGTILAEAGELKKSTEVPDTVAEQIHFLGETNIKNPGAVRNLMTMGAQRRYASFGKRLPISRLLPGIGIDVLGPPTLEQSSAIADQARIDDEFWHVAARRAAATPRARERSPRLFPRSPIARRRPQEARWVIPQINKMRAEEMLAIVRSLDGVLNNTSLILLFQIQGTLLVFPGDAQIENWRYALRDAENAAEIRRRLARARFYKVGHHGSLNATPKSLWNRFAHLNGVSTPDRLVTMVSTRGKKHGSTKDGTEVPRRTLIEELQQKSTLYNTQSLRSKKRFWHDVCFEL